MDIVSPTITNLIIFVLAIYVGYHVVWTVTPALHTPLMAVTNAISAIVIVGAMLAAALTETTLGRSMGVLAIYVGYHVVWTVTPALHTPLMAVTNAVSAIVVVGAMLAAALTAGGFAKFMGVAAVALAAVNVFGGFLVTRRMLEMFKKKSPAKKVEK